MNHFHKTMPTTAIDRMRVRYQSELTMSEARTQAIRAKLQVLDELATEEKQIGNIGESTPVTSNSSIKTDMLPPGLTAACRFVVDHFGTTHPMTTRNVIDQLSAGGYDVAKKNFTGIVMVTLKRLAKNRRVLVEKKRGKWVFRANPETPPL